MPKHVETRGNICKLPIKDGCKKMLAENPQYEKVELVRRKSECKQERWVFVQERVVWKERMFEPILEILRCGCMNYTTLHNYVCNHV